MSFFNSAINQVGRDLGKVVSNQVFKDSHSTPYRTVAHKNANVNQGEIIKRVDKTNFDKLVGALEGVSKPSTKLEKLSLVYLEIRNEGRRFLEDGYLDNNEAVSLFSMISILNQKAEEISHLLDINKEKNKNEIEALDLLMKKVQETMREIMKAAKKGAEAKKAELIQGLEGVESISFWRYIKLNVIWMGNYARGGVKSITKTVLANVIDILTLTFLISRPFLFLQGIFTYRKEAKRRATIKDWYATRADLESKRLVVYNSFVSA